MAKLLISRYLLSVSNARCLRESGYVRRASRQVYLRLVELVGVGSGSTRDWFDRSSTKGLDPQRLSFFLLNLLRFLSHISLIFFRSMNFCFCFTSTFSLGFFGVPSVFAKCTKRAIFLRTVILTFRCVIPLTCFAPLSVTLVIFMCLRRCQVRKVEADRCLSILSFSTCFVADVVRTTLF